VVNDKNIEIGINEVGKKQAKKTGKYFKNRKIKDVIIYTSPSNISYYKYSNSLV
jgi:broad specificity phosphatase PhoE